MLAIEFVKVAVVGRVVLWSVPPVPVATFGDEQFLERQLALFVRTTQRSLGVEIAGVVKIIPGAIVLRRTDPYIEICVDPRPWNQRSHRVEISMPLDCLRNC